MLLNYRMAQLECRASQSTEEKNMNPWAWNTVTTSREWVQIFENWRHIHWAQGGINHTFFLYAFQEGLREEALSQLFCLKNCQPCSSHCKFRQTGVEIRKRQHRWVCQILQTVKEIPQRRLVRPSDSTRHVGNYLNVMCDANKSAICNGTTALYSTVDLLHCAAARWR